ncbi:hypothetical protein ONS95_010480 [Cadophora gregata]|uniref:uncharacterized protein n=1 Tax=Cadophora gregata TaxID=51156 RepID=UPI0026DC6A85|nr:uncharacterized protein ONS95_010480 [Cadophora gregata]KAK0122227.1 hypothetical protein ONS95_010480 [Cadophora gregata]KAK0127703.1 hypothetical protein ONS96_007221 [Cadophora gregata f. sp. sojae]
MRAPKKPLNDEQYLAKYKKPRKCLHCTNSKRLCTGGRPCDGCEKNGRVCINVMTRLPFATPGTSQAEENQVAAHNNGAQVGFDETNKTSEDDRPVEDPLRQEDGQEPGGYSEEDLAAMLGHDIPQFHHYPPLLEPAPAYLQPTHSRAEDEMRHIRARDRGGLILQPQFPRATPQRVNISEAIELPEGWNWYPQDTFRYVHGPGLYNSANDFDGLGRAPVYM